MSALDHFVVDYHLSLLRPPGLAAQRCSAAAPPLLLDVFISGIFQVATIFLLRRHQRYAPRGGGGEEKGQRDHWQPAALKHVYGLGGEEQGLEDSLWSGFELSLPYLSRPST
ncbi:hypothetical protein L209DRAFT_402695 [Thermothelomyces heterothallicus CBS 203.75]